MLNRRVVSASSFYLLLVLGAAKVINLHFKMNDDDEFPSSRSHVSILSRKRFKHDSHPPSFVFRVKLMCLLALALPQNRFNAKQKQKALINHLRKYFYCAHNVDIFRSANDEKCARSHHETFETWHVFNGGQQKCTESISLGQEDGQQLKLVKLLRHILWGKFLVLVIEL